MSDLDDITKRMKPNKVHGVPEPTVTQEDVYKGIYNAADFLAKPSQYLNKAGSDIWKGDYGNQYGSEATGGLLGLLPFLLANKHPLALISGYVAPNVINSTLHERAIEDKAKGYPVSNAVVANTALNAVADLHPAMFVPKMASQMLAAPISNVSEGAASALDNVSHFGIFNPWMLASLYADGHKGTVKYVNNKWDDYKRNLKYAWDNDKQSIPFVATSGLLDYAIRSLFDNRLQDF